MSTPGTRLHHVLAVGERFGRMRVDAPSPSPSPAPAPAHKSAPVGASFETVQALARNDVDLSQDFKAKDIENTQATLHRMQVWLQQAKVGDQHIRDKGVRHRLGLPSADKVRELPTAGREKWYSAYGKKEQPRLWKFTTVANTADTRYLDELITHWNYKERMVYQGQNISLEEYATFMTNKWTAAEAEKLGADRDLVPNATLAWARFMTQEGRFPDHLFLSPEMISAMDRELAETWGPLEPDTLERWGSNGPSDVAVVLAASLLEMALERMEIYARKVRQLHEPLLKHVQQRPVISDDEAPERRTRETMETAILLAREEYARAYSIYKLSVPQIHTLAARMCCALSHTLATIFLERQEKLLGYVYDAVWTHLANGRQQYGNLERPPFRNVALLGDPGTGKTRTAGMLAAVFAHSGMLLRTGATTLYEVRPGQLVAEFKGQTDARVEDAMRLGSERTIFIDEAYQIGEATAEPGRKNSPSLTKLVQYLSENAGQFVLIVAGYEANIESDFFQPNEGMRRRFKPSITLLNKLPLELARIWAHQMGDLAAEWDVKRVVPYLAAVIGQGKPTDVFADPMGWRTDTWRDDDATHLFATQADAMQKLSHYCALRMRLAPLGNARFKGPPVPTGVATQPAAAIRGRKSPRVGDGAGAQDAGKRPQRRAKVDAAQKLEREKEKSKARRDAGAATPIDVDADPDGAAAGATDTYGVEDMRDVLMSALLDGRAERSAEVVYERMDDVLPTQDNRVFAAKVQQMANAQAQFETKQKELLENGSAGEAALRACPPPGRAGDGDDDDDDDDGAGSSSGSSRGGSRRRTPFLFLEHDPTWDAEWAPYDPGGAPPGARGEPPGAAGASGGAGPSEPPTPPEPHSRRGL